ncbi:hypothetical protein [Devosia sp. 2618]|uniref:hypothetical protein n=1 Tax=Devosia sp. 2618 TaxID=3156454 RepID=UPI0033910801
MGGIDKEAEMVNFCFCRENILAKYAPLLDASIQEDDPRYDDYMIVMGTEFRAEAYASQEARDARLGPAGEHIEYVPVSPEDVAAVEYPLCRMAIGPALNDDDFERVASAVLGAAIDFDGAEDASSLHLDVVIARTEYLVRSVGPSGLPQVSWRPLFEPCDPQDDQKLERETACWLRGFVAGHFALMVH